MVLFVDTYAFTVSCCLDLKCLYFYLNSIDVPELEDRVSDLFKSHPDLVVGFKTFLAPCPDCETGCCSNPNKSEVSIHTCFMECS